MIKNNIELKEITKFDLAAAHWWDIDGKFKVLHKINPLRVNYILSCANGLFAKKVLDIGCGGGILAESMAREGAIVTGLDMSIKQILVARSHALNNGLKINYIQQSIEEYSKLNLNNYDIITCMEMLEHVPDPQSIVNYCAKLIKPNGDVFFSTLNRNFKSWLLAIICAEYLLHMIPERTHNFNKFIKPSELLSWIDLTSLHELHIVGLEYNLLKDNFKLSNNIDINYILHTRCIK